MKPDKKMQKMKLNSFLLVSKRYNSKENLKKIDKIKSIIQELNTFLGEDTINSIMRTHKNYKYGVNFLQFLDLHKKFDTETITKKLNLKNSRLIESWYRGYPPRPIRTLLNIYFKNYHKINNKDLASLFGWGFGDGGITSELSYYFICGKKEDLLTIKEHLNKEIPYLPIILNKNFGKNTVKHANGKIRTIEGYDSWILHFRDSAFCKILYSLGLPKGNKVLQKTFIPNWIKQGDRIVKKAFLDSLFEGELQKHKVNYNFKRNKIDICPITFGLNKVDYYKSNLIDFLNEIKRLLDEFNIKSYEVTKPKPSTIRKDGKITYFSRFYISTSALNTLRFSRLIDYPFNKEKKESLQVAIEEAKLKIKDMNLQLNKYKEASELFKKGRSIYKIAKELNIEYTTARHWLKTKEHLPRLINPKGELIYEI